MNNIDDLFFIHIPKTGGRSIAKVGQSHGLAWGFFLLEQTWYKTLACSIYHV